MYFKIMIASIILGVLSGVVLVKTNEFLKVKVAEKSTVVGK